MPQQSEMTSSYSWTTKEPYQTVMKIGLLENLYDNPFA